MVLGLLPRREPPEAFPVLGHALPMNCVTACVIVTMKLQRGHFITPILQTRDQPQKAEVAHPRLTPGSWWELVGQN